MPDSPLPVRRVGDVGVIAAPAYISAEGGEQIHDAASGLRQDGVTRLVLDLGGCTMANSVGISFLIEVVESTKEAGGRLAFCRVNKTIAKTLQIMGLLQVATVHDDEDQAVEQVARQ